MDWFVTRELGLGVWLVAEPFHVNSFLVEGTESRLHIDTGLGIADIREAGDDLSERTPRVANTHHHFDHVGGNARFDEVAIHRLGAALLAAGTDERWLEGYRSWAVAMYTAWDAFRAADRDFFSLTDDVATLRPLPEGTTWDAWTVPANQATSTFEDGDTLDLGKRSLRVIHTPGHTSDSACFLDESTGALFTGDTVNSGLILVDDPTASLEDFARSTRRLADEVMPEVSAVYMSHGARFAAEPGYLTEVAEAFEACASGEARLERVEDAFSGWVRVASFARCSIVLPDA